MIGALLIASMLSLVQNAGVCEIRGRVTDHTGGVLAGVAIILKSSDLEKPLATVSDQVGRYRLTDVPEGNFDITFKLTGFLAQSIHAAAKKELSPIDISPALIIDPAKAQIETMSFSALDHDNLLPYYASELLGAGVTGQILLEVEWQKGRVHSVKLLQESLESPGNWEKIHNAARELAIKRIMSTVEQWESYVVSRFITPLRIRLERSGNVQPSQRNYLLRYDDHGVVNELIITGPWIRH